MAFQGGHAVGPLERRGDHGPGVGSGRSLRTVQVDGVGVATRFEEERFVGAVGEEDRFQGCRGRADRAWGGGACGVLILSRSGGEGQTA